VKKYNRANLNEVANTYKKMILEDLEYSPFALPPTPPAGRRPAPWNPLGDTPLYSPFLGIKPPPPKPLPDDLDDLPFDLSPEFPDRPIRPGSAGWINRLPNFNPTPKPSIGRGAGRLVLPALLGWSLGDFIDQEFLSDRPRPPKPNQLRPLPNYTLPSPESLYPGPSSLPYSPPIGGGGKGGGGSSSGGGMGGM
jgi:hypothetical protein